MQYATELSKYVMVSHCVLWYLSCLLHILAL